MSSPVPVLTRVDLKHERAVDRGVAFLDAKLGREVWLPRIDFTTLNVGSCDRCVACQAAGVPWYGEALEALGISLELMHATHESAGSWTEEHGFGLTYVNVAQGKMRDFDGLTDAWRRRVEQLRAEATS